MTDSTKPEQKRPQEPEGIVNGKLKLSTGKVAELKPLNLAQRAECRSIETIEYNPSGSMCIRGSFAAGIRWAMYATGSRNLEELEGFGYSDAELVEIGAAVKAENEINPTTA